MVFTPSAIRYDIGNDYVNYLRIFELGNYSQYFTREPGFYLVNFFYDTIDAHFQWVFATFSLIFTAVAFRSLPRKNAWLLYFLFFATLWFPSFNIIRQSIALSWCLLALTYYFDKRYIAFYLLIFVACCFHRSALVIALLGSLAQIPVSNRFKTHIAPVLFLTVLGIAYFSTDAILLTLESGLRLLSLDIYAGYFNSIRHFIPRDFGTGLGAMVKVMFSIYLVVNTKYFVRKNGQYWFLIILVFFYALGVILASKIVIFGRMADIFVVGQILGAYFLWHLPKNRALNKLIVLVFLLFLLMTFFKISFGTPTSYADPKLNPYQTIFI